MSKDKIEVNMNVYDIPIVIEVLEEANKEIERLNNIINDLEKYLQENINNIYAYFDNAPFGVEETYKEVLSKLQELKGVNKQ